MKAQTFDAKCHDLASAFLRPDAGIDLKNALAAEIQNTIEEFLSEAGEEWQ